MELIHYENCHGACSCEKPCLPLTQFLDVLSTQTLYVGLKLPAAAPVTHVFHLVRKTTAVDNFWAEHASLCHDIEGMLRFASRRQKTILSAAFFDEIPEFSLNRVFVNIAWLARTKRFFAMPLHSGDACRLLHPNKWQTLITNAAFSPGVLRRPIQQGLLAVRTRRLNVKGGFNFMLVNVFS